MNKIINLVSKNKLLSIVVVTIILVLGVIKINHKENTFLNSAHSSKETVWVKVETTGRGIRSDNPVSTVLVIGNDKITSYYLGYNNYSKKYLSLLDASKMSDKQLIDYAQKHLGEVSGASSKEVRSGIRGIIWTIDKKVTKERIMGNKVAQYDKNGEKTTGGYNSIIFNGLAGNKKIGDSYYSGYTNNYNYDYATLTKVKNDKVKYSFDKKNRLVEER